MKYENITFIGLNYFPESTAIGLYSTQWVEFLESKGAKINVVTAFPYYPQWEIAPEYKKKPTFFSEKIGSTQLYRYKQYTPKKPTFGKRIIHILDFTFGSFFNLFKIKKCDLVISVIPFTSSALLGYIQKKRFGAKSWVHIQDFEFDAAFQSGLTKKSQKGVIYKILMVLERAILNRADTVSTISNMMLQSLQKKSKAPTYFLPNWIDNKTIDPSKSKIHPFLTSGKVKVLYSGNIGDKQDWKLFLALLKIIDHEKFEFTIVGDGAYRQQLEREISSYKGVRLFPPVPYEELSDLLCSADVQLLFQKSDVLDTVMPSKILGMMASAKPSIITGHSDSEVKKVIEQSNGGYYIDEVSAEKVLYYLDKIASNTQQNKIIGLNARQYVIENFAKEEILERFWISLNNL